MALCTGLGKTSAAVKSQDFPQKRPKMTALHPRKTNVLFKLDRRLTKNLTLLNNLCYCCEKKTFFFEPSVSE